MSGMNVGAAQVVDRRSLDVVEHHPFGVPIGAVRLGSDLAVIALVGGGVVWASTRAPILRDRRAAGLVARGPATDGGHLWVSDWATGIVWQLAFEGQDVVAAAPIAFELANPEGLAFDPDGGLLVVESGAGRLSRIDLATGEVEEIAAGLELGLPPIAGVAPSALPNGVAVDASGAIYVTGDIGNVLYEITRR